MKKQGSNADISIVMGASVASASDLVLSLIQAGDHVVVVDDLRCGNLSKLGDLLRSNSVTFVYVHDASDEAAIGAALLSAGFDRVKAVYDCAEAGAPVGEPSRPIPATHTRLSTRRGGAFLAS